jgi:3-hydroxyacyl-CoA dehydrogenase
MAPARSGPRGAAADTRTEDQLKPGGKALSIPKVAAVIGAGTMGPGMAAVLARAGSEVRLYDISDEVLKRAKAGAELVLEAIPEKLELKREVIAQLEEHLTEDAIIASNTSGIPITSIATALKHPARLVGMHWSNPPHLIPMIEVVPGEQTAAATTDKITGIIRAFGYEAVTEKEVPGFVENRILYAILRECLSLVERGIVSEADLDTCVKWGIGYKLAVIGPMRCSTWRAWTSTPASPPTSTPTCPPPPRCRP